MKKLILIFTAVLFVTASFAFSVPGKEVSKFNVASIFIPVGNSGKTISFMELSAINTKDFQSLTGEKMNFFERLSFKLSQKKIKKMINADGTVDNEKFEKLKFGENDKASFWKGFIIGLLLSVIGVLICLLISVTHKGDSYKRSVFNGSLVGCSVSVLILLLTLL